MPLAELMSLLEPPQHNTLAAACWLQIMDKPRNIIELLESRHRARNQSRDELSFAEFRIAAVLGYKILLIEAQIRALALTQNRVFLDAAITIAASLTEAEINKIRPHIDNCEQPINLVIDYADYLHIVENDAELLMSVINASSSLDHYNTSLALNFDTIASVCGRHKNSDIMRRLESLRLNTYCMNCGNMH